MPSHYESLNSLEREEGSPRARRRRRPAGSARRGLGLGLGLGLGSWVLVEGLRPNKILFGPS